MIFDKSYQHKVDVLKAGPSGCNQTPEILVTNPGGRKNGTWFLGEGVLKTDKISTKSKKDGFRVRFSLFSEIGLIPPCCWYLHAFKR